MSTSLDTTEHASPAHHSAEEDERAVSNEHAQGTAVEDNPNVGEAAADDAEDAEEEISQDIVEVTVGEQQPASTYK